MLSSSSITAWCHARHVPIALLLMCLPMLLISLKKSVQLSTASSSSSASPFDLPFDALTPEYIAKNSTIEDSSNGAANFSKKDAAALRGKTKNATLDDSDGPRSKNSYVFLIAGCDPASPGYRGFLYTVLISVRVLRSYGSRADMFLFLQMSPSAKNDTLPAAEHEFLKKMRVRYRYIPRPGAHSFYESVFAKFRVLSLVEYERVLFLDADVVPLVNLDYMFESPLIKENLIVATKQEPANAGLFMLAPSPGDFEKLEEIIRLRHERAVKGNGAAEDKWDKRLGWGHRIVPPDHWQALIQNDTKWSFNCATSDQGLLYHWVKYVKQSVSIVIGQQIQNWGTRPSDGKLVMESATDGLLDKVSPPSRTLLMDNCKQPGWRSYVCKVPYRDYVHFFGSTKPWQKKLPGGIDWTWAINDTKVRRTREVRANKRELGKLLWFTTLVQLDEELGFGLGDVRNNWSKIQKKIGPPPLGARATLGDMDRHIARVKKENDKQKTNNNESSSSIGR